MDIVWFLVHSLIFLSIIVLTQDVQIFPAIIPSFFKTAKRDPNTLPSDVESTFITTEDGKRLELWRLPAEPGVSKQPYVAIVFHGNAGTLENFFAIQLWFSQLGITSYCLDYRGFGRSSGWPSERGIERDSDAYWDYVVAREQIDASKVIVFGISVGGAPAARISAIHQPKTLVLVAAFTTIKRVIRDIPVFGLLANFSWYKFPTIDYVKRLESSNLLLCHGERDKTVYPYHTEILQEAYGGSGAVKRVTSATSEHNMVFYAMKDQLADALFETLN